MPMNNPTLDMLLRGIGTTESGNNYNAIGPKTKKGNRAYGYSQVMDTNIPSWTQQYYGQQLTPEQYLNTPEAQVAVTQGKLGDLLQKYHTPQDAASVWFSGRPLQQAGNASDGFLKTPEYIQRVMQAGGMPGSFNNARTFQATGTDDMANAAMQPPGAQSISLGNQENQQPFNNIGSTLANMGASIASLDNRGTGIASLNASRVAQNLTAQEAAREKEDTPQLVGFNADKSMMMMRKGDQIYSVATPQGFGGLSSDDLTSNQKEYKAQQNDPAYADWVKNKDKLEPSLSQDTRRMYAIRAIKGDNTWTKEIGGDKQGAVDKRAIDEEITNVANDLHMSPDDIMKARTEQRYRSKVADRIAQIDVNTETASNKIEAAATNLIETSKQYPRGDIRFLEGIKQKWDEQTNDPKLQALKTAVDAFALDYATALNPQKTSPTVDDVRNARNKILTTMNQESLEAAVGIVQREIGSIRTNARRTHEQFFGSVEENKPKENTNTKRLKFNPQTGELE